MLVPSWQPSAAGAFRPLFFLLCCYFSRLRCLWCPLLFARRCRNAGQGACVFLLVKRSLCTSFLGFPLFLPPVVTRYIPPRCLPRNALLLSSLRLRQVAPRFPNRHRCSASFHVLVRLSSPPRPKAPTVSCSCTASRYAFPRRVLEAGCLPQLPAHQLRASAPPCASGERNRLLGSRRRLLRAIPRAFWLLPVIVLHPAPAHPRSPLSVRRCSAPLHRLACLLGTFPCSRAWPALLLTFLAEHLRLGCCCVPHRWSLHFLPVLATPSPSPLDRGCRPCRCYAARTLSASVCDAGASVTDVLPWLADGCG
ncbi:hypothetical protein, conserved in T. vivax [Trypanosoma vivax Y486]|uniref:Uncharacterized protein n=1 Tax=Trypanosoma vivax (strain Y486) TaxID=1055687 RepID=F9WKR4_TRYVY|nr:hypothetical protein, conserved in T. vivax [Trypanosoma vivax Y486]|eukprot:CCD18087.1 hypothetical protein, conserved in T. vivax [Trypanosoma vivax Y486]